MISGTSAVVYFLIALILNSSSFAQVVRPIEEEIIPPGTRLLRDSTYLDETEITNSSWLEYLYYLKKDSSNSYFVSMLPDTNVWKDFRLPSVIVRKYRKFGIDSTYYDDYPDHYLRYPGFIYRPVVGISYSQAKAYCQWRSKAVNEVQNRRLKEKGKDYRVRYEYYLPAKGDLKFAAGSSVGIRKIGRAQSKNLRKLSPDFNSEMNFPRAVVDQRNVLPLALSTVAIDGINFVSYIYENGTGSDLGFYSVIGNVSEITNVEGESFGGSWIHSMSEIVEGNYIIRYTKPTYWLGFRCACRIFITESK